MKLNKKFKEICYKEWVMLRHKNRYRLVRANLKSIHFHCIFLRQKTNKEK